MASSPTDRWSFVGVTVSTVDDPALAPMIAAQEREVMDRYGVDDAGPAPSPGIPCLVADLDGRAIGCVAVDHVTETTAELKRMYVTPDARGHGVARRLLESAEQLARARGCRQMRLETGTQQPEALALYEQAGWRRIPCYGYFKDDPTTICLQKVLGC